MTTPSNLRLLVLANLVQRAPDQKLGRTQLMKLMYFLQELKGVPLNYNFTLFTYGPFDLEVLSDLSTACGLGVVAEEEILYANSYGYKITPTTKATSSSIELSQVAPDVAAKIHEVLEQFGNYGAAELELRSTVLFVDRDLSSTDHRLPAGDLAKRVRQIKPHFSDEVILKRINEMNEGGLLQSTVA
jgi:uncharacterized protein